MTRDQEREALALHDAVLAEVAESYTAAIGEAYRKRTRVGEAWIDPVMHELLSEATQAWAEYRSRYAFYTPELNIDRPEPPARLEGGRAPGVTMIYGRPVRIMPDVEGGIAWDTGPEPSVEWP